jgi:prepilin-type N-terminal cleavage/methylation domain-containing protein
MRTNKLNFSGFTIVEVVIVVAIIAIVSAVAYVSYGNVTARAKDISVQGDMDRLNDAITGYLAHRQLQKLSSTPFSYYSGEGHNDDLNFSPSADNVLDVVVSAINPADYCIRAYNRYGTKNSISNSYTSESTSGVCAQIGPSTEGLGCPVGFIAVQGSATYGTSNFCVMKYEASHSDATSGVQGTSTVPVSSSGVQKWISVTQANAVTYSHNVVNCVGCNLITEAQWMTIAQDVLSVPSNWTNGVVGSGAIYSGHNDNTPASAQLASDNDALGYTNTSNVAPSNQRRTLTLPNGEVIWDFAGNVSEWTQGTIAIGQEPGLSGDVAYNYREWNNGSFLQKGLLTTSMPSSTAIAGITWASSSGIGTIYCKYNADTVIHVFWRGGNWANTTNAGVLALGLDQASNATSTSIGFRVTR